VVRRSMSWIEPDLDKVLGSSEFLQRHHAQDNDQCARGIAPFHRSEIQTGKVLGQGGFSVVYEVTALTLSTAVSARCSPQEQALREEYARQGGNKFCLKHLQERLLTAPKDFAVAASDLAVEAAYLSALDHPHIVSVRGLPQDGLHAWIHNNSDIDEDETSACAQQHDGYFIFMDRLHTTLDQRILEWKRSSRPRGASSDDLEVEEHRPPCDETTTTTTSSTTTVAQKMVYARQLADALAYLHAHRIVFRDLKPQNVGFLAAEDGGDRLQLFDFGLCRELPPQDEAHHPLEGTYEMSGVGTRRYMAPEIITTGCYNDKADTYSWSLLVWEMLRLVKPYAFLSEMDHTAQVCGEKGRRPPLLDNDEQENQDYQEPQWPAWIGSLLQHGWDCRLQNRFTMRQVCDWMEAHMADGAVSDGTAAVIVPDKENLDNDQDLNVTNHEMIELIPKAPKDAAAMPRSPTSVHDFRMENAVAAMKGAIGLASLDYPLPELQDDDEDDAAPQETAAVDFESIGGGGEARHHQDSSPPPAPQKPTSFLQLSEIAMRRIGLPRENLAASDDDDDISDLYSDDESESFAGSDGHSSVDQEFWEW